MTLLLKFIQTLIQFEWTLFILSFLLSVQSNENKREFKRNWWWNHLDKFRSKNNPFVVWKLSVFFSLSRNAWKLISVVFLNSTQLIRMFYHLIPKVKNSKVLNHTSEINFCSLNWVERRKKNTKINKIKHNNYTCIIYCKIAMSGARYIFCVNELSVCLSM